MKGCTPGKLLLPVLPVLAPYMVPVAVDCVESSSLQRLWNDQQ